jgi:hypothetical protein
MLSLGCIIFLILGTKGERNSEAKSEQYWLPV